VLFFLCDAVSLAASAVGAWNATGGQIVSFFGTEEHNSVCDAGTFCGAFGSASTSPFSGNSPTLGCEPGCGSLPYLSDPNGSPFFNQQVDASLAGMVEPARTVTMQGPWALSTGARPGWGILARHF